MRISTGMMQRLAIQSILDRQSDLSTVQQQLATGRRITTPSDDPSGATQVLQLTQQKELTDQYQTNASRALSRLQLEEGVLVAAGESLQRVRELAVQGLNGSLGQQNRSAIAAEVRQRLDELLQLANTKDGSGEYLFAGYQGQTTPFVDAGSGVYNYQGDQGRRNLQISPTRQVGSSDDGYSVFVNIPYSGGGSQNIFKTLYDLAVSLENNAPVSTALTDIDAAMDNIFQVRASIGARVNAIESQKDINDQFMIQLNKSLSEIQDLDYAEAVGRLNLQQVGLEAAQQSFQRIQNLSLFKFL